MCIEAPHAGIAATMRLGIWTASRYQASGALRIIKMPELPG
jgi:hypothetical protein